MDVPRAYRAEIGWLFQTGLLVFIVTVVIGILNGTKVLGDLSREVILTHVHAGTLGWITLAVFAATIWILGPGMAPGRETRLRQLVLLSALAIPVYVAAFFSGNLPARAITGTILLLIIVLWWVLAITEARRVGWARLTLTQLGVGLSLTSLVVGSSFGVLVQIQLATARELLSTGPAIGAHATAQVFGYLVLMAASIADWQLRPGAARGRLGTALAAVLFVAGLSIAAGILFNVLPLLGVSTLLQLVAVVLVLVRLGGAARRVRWLDDGPARHFAIAVGFLVVAQALTVFLLVKFIQAEGDFTKIPGGILVASDHSMFVGVMTNVLFGLVAKLTVARRDVWRWADGVIFWGMNVGVAAFIVVLVLQVTSLERFTAPVMGVSILLGIATYTMRLRPASQEVSAPAPA